MIYTGNYFIAVVTFEINVHISPVHNGIGEVEVVYNTNLNFTPHYTYIPPFGWKRAILGKRRIA